ncbi:MAG: M28 family peptidase [Bacteroidaceae bacterium]|nr:M28 family peptidase [Bacteroidaceae bacterium]
MKQNNLLISKFFNFYILTAAVLLLLAACKNGTTTTETVYEQQSPDFNADSAYLYIAEQCAFGPRVMNSEAHDACAAYIAAKFESFGAQVVNQDAEGTLYDGTKVQMRNIVASYNLDNPVRLIICSHWDSRPWADHDANADNHRTPIDGANDGASGVAVMMEIARQIQQKTPEIGVDLICFDAEDCGTPEWDDHGEDNSWTWCIGSQYWAGKHHIDGYTARYGILLDMVGGSNCVFEKEAYSMAYAPSVVDKVWSKAIRLGYGDLFKNANGGGVTDDHVQVNMSGIPCIDIIARDANDNTFCKTWHTKNDNVGNINKQTLKAVGQTVMEVIYTEQ